ncbi:MAG TPA: oligosaccharide flippase family protein [Candidatus Saccharimonadia bacterium]|nr:oligosaccharide flippase family protein [Candidatus Saccharimonadia bacterium]
MTTAVWLTPISVRLQALRASSLVVNAFYLMLSTFVVAAAGLGFWVVVARTHDTAAVGLATTLLSVSGLLSLLGLGGFDTTFVRFLPRSEHKNDYINSGFIIVTLASAGLALALALVLPRISPQLSMLGSGWALVGFVFFTVVTSLNVLTNAVFLAYKEARYIFAINATFSAFKVMLPLVVVNGGAMGIFVLAGLAQLLGLVLSVAWMYHRFGYRFSPRLDVDALRVVRKFSVSVYFSSVLNLIPPTVLPLIIIHQLGPEPAAFYYMAFTIAGVLYTIAYASMQSVFAEGSHDETAIRAHVTKAARMIGVTLVPAALVVAALSGWLLGVFGRAYAAQAGALLQIFALSALPVAVYSALGAIFKVTKNLRGVVAMNVTYAGVILGLSFLWVPHGGLLTVGWAWALGNVAACGVGGLCLMGINNKRLGV